MPHTIHKKDGTKLLARSKEMEFLSFEELERARIKRPFFSRTYIYQTILTLKSTLPIPLFITNNVVLFLIISNYEIRQCSAEAEVTYKASNNVLKK